MENDRNAALKLKVLTALSFRPYSAVISGVEPK